MKYIVWVKEDGKWEENGDGPLTEIQANRISREIAKECGCRTRVLPVGVSLPEAITSRESRIAKRVTAKSIKADAELYKDQLEKAQSVFAYTPFEYAWDDPAMQRRIQRERKDISKRIDAIIDLMPIPTSFIVVGLEDPRGHGVLTFNNEDDLLVELARRGVKMTGRANRSQLRKELQGKPEFDSLIGPMYDGAKKVRYETQAVYDRMSI
jgi:hypothetical protein